nr:hypothetical protein [Tanacetum cinerariifolium]
MVEVVGEMWEVEKLQKNRRSGVAGYGGKEGSEQCLFKHGGRHGVLFGFLQGLAFTIPALERVTIGCCEVGGGGWLGMVLIVELEVLIVELFIDLFVGLFVVVFVEEKVPEKDRWCGTRGEFMWWKGVRVTKAPNVRR